MNVPKSALNGGLFGEGVLDWESIIRIVKEKCPRDIVFSVECGTPDRAAKSLAHVSKLV